MVLRLPVYQKKGKTERVIFRCGLDFKDSAVNKGETVLWCVQFQPTCLFFCALTKTALIREDWMSLSYALFKNILLLFKK